ncbi:nucleotidyl transferase AbiEii/AbiGii toxin family protein [Jatrophihabitans cynanchi]|uniref:Nucleotidyl transferase AbiEii/AbiGii toxin family protein n=1 Tax=Jatrophihabitans cynanchi TaxID=2944128 RepID=A0ABY7JW49_9ACTN|nr:nucleotidyl transferase AbiEii/AbiGii toxin family protein [Jatrophihabitans sp. SB3-54]WAX56210.1 nucleotidyl transferase AbiEii/AbiGii toxin family protein [Jatrophihabitans sp. SB3-54]
MTNPEARRWRDAAPEQFAAAILAAAEQLGVLPLAVEKDYWVCEALRAITLSHPGEVIFKGGTSLEKLRIIRRFSEDLDLLVVGGHPSDNATKNALKAMLNSAATASLGEPSDVKSGGKQGSYWRRGYLVPHWFTRTPPPPSRSRHGTRCRPAATAHGRAVAVKHGGVRGRR